MIERSSAILAGEATRFAGRAFMPLELTRSLLPSQTSIGAIAAAALAPPLLEIAAYARAEPPVALSPSAVQFAAAQAGAAQSISAPQARELALLSADVFADTPNPPAGYRVATEGDLGKLGLKPQDLTSTQSPFRARVYVKGAGADAQYVVAFRGSSSGGDWTANAQQALGRPSDHYRRALYIGSRLAQTPGANVTITGHSLGGGLASAAAIASGRPATTFNAAGLSDATIRDARAIHRNSGVTTTDSVRAYYVRGEILSALQDGGDRAIGGLFGGLIGAAVADAPEAYGNRIGMNAVRPEGLRWYQDNPVARHGMDWVLASLPR